MVKVAPFDLNDRALIERARSTGQPEHIARAIQAAMDGFAERLSQMEPPVVKGEMLVFLVKPANYFDDYCQALVLQDIANDTGLRIARCMAKGAPGQKQPATPDVEFLDPSHSPNPSEKLQPP